MKKLAKISANLYDFSFSENIRGIPTSIEMANLMKNDFFQVRKKPFWTNLLKCWGLSGAKVCTLSTSCRSRQDLSNVYLHAKLASTKPTTTLSKFPTKCKRIYMHGMEENEFIFFRQDKDLPVRSSTIILNAERKHVGVGGWRGKGGKETHRKIRRKSNLTSFQETWWFQRNP